MLRTTKHERDALYATRQKLADALKFLKANGFKEEQIFEAATADGFGSLPIQRNEFGLPSFPVPKDEGPRRVEKADSKGSGDGSNPFVDKMKSKLFPDNIASATSPPTIPVKQNELPEAPTGETKSPDVSSKPAEPQANMDKSDAAATMGSQDKNVEFITPGAEWQTMKKKSRIRSPDESPPMDSTPPNTFKNLTMVDEVEAKLAAAQNLAQPLTRSQRKKLRKASKAGGSPTPASSLL
ncbi:hypothetical protein ACET3Z_021320 [Daucus carota]